MVSSLRGECEMSKDKFTRIYLNISLVLVVLLLIMVSVFLMEFPVGMNGTASATILQVDLTSGGEVVSIFNWPLVFAFAVLILNVLILVKAMIGTPLDKQIITETLVYNVVLSLLMVASTIIFMLLIPETINGYIEHKIFRTKIFTQSEDFTSVFNFSYVIMGIYVIYNYVVLRITKEAKVVVEKELQV